MYKKLATPFLLLLIMLAHGWQLAFSLVIVLRCSLTVKLSVGSQLTFLSSLLSATLFL